MDWKSFVWNHAESIVLIFGIIMIAFFALTSPKLIEQKDVVDKNYFDSKFYVLDENLRNMQYIQVSSNFWLSCFPDYNSVKQIEIPLDNQGTVKKMQSITLYCPTSVNK